MSSNTSEEKDVYLKFDGEDTKKYREWATKVKAIAVKKGWIEAINKDITIDRKSKDAAQIELNKTNDKAYHYLVMSCSGKAFDYVQAAEVDDTYGDARKAWKDLKKRYSDLTENDLIALTVEFNACCMKKPSDDPMLWYAELEHIQAKMVRAGAQKKSDAELVATIMVQIPKEYEAATQALRIKPPVERTLELVQRVYSDYWIATYKHTTAPSPTVENVALYSDTTKGPNANKQGKKPWKKYKGVCSWCGIQGHKAVECNKRKAAENKPDGTRVPENQKKCYRCKKTGHISRNCPDKTEDDKKDAFFVGMCEEANESDEPTTENPTNNSGDGEEDFEPEYAQCSCCGDVGWSGLMCERCESAIYENEIDPNEIPGSNDEDDENEDEDEDEDEESETKEEQAPTATATATVRRFQAPTLELPVMNALRKEKEELLKAMRLTGWDFGWCEVCEAVGPVYTRCKTCANNGVISNHTIPTGQERDDDQHQVNQTGIEGGSVSKWLIDSGASVHVTNDRNDLQGAQATQQEVTIGDGKAMTAKLTGSKPTVLMDGTGNKIELKEMLFIPSFNKKIISLSRLLDDGYQVQAWTKEHFILHKDKQQLKIHRKQGQVMYYITGTVLGINEVFQVERSMEINEAHDKLAHVGEDILRQTMKNYNVRLTGTLLPCDACMRAKARAKDLKKKSTNPATSPGERLCLDASGPFEPSIGGARFDAKIVDQFSRKTWSGHMKSKDQIQDLVKGHLDALNGQGKQVKFLRCDNAGEQGNKLAAICKERGIQLEYTAPNTPQQNGIVERKIATDRNRAHTMLLAAQLTDQARTMLRAEAESTATKLSNMAWNMQVKGIPNEIFQPNISHLRPEHLIEFGRIGYVTVRKQIKKKWTDKSVKCVMVGYADDHSGDTYRMYDPMTNTVRCTRDVKWAAWTRSDPKETMKIFEAQQQPMSSQMTGIDEEYEINYDSEDSTEHESGRNANVNIPPAVAPPAKDDEGNDDEVGGDEDTTTTTVKKPRCIRELKSLRASFNDTLVTPATADNTEEINLAIDLNVEKLCFTTELSSDPGAPKTLREALSGRDAERWRASIAQEIMNFLRRKAWRKVPMSQVRNEGRIPISSKPVFKIKDEQDGSKRYKTRIVTRGFLMIPGVDYTESFSPVTTETGVRTVIGVSLHYINEDLRNKVKTEDQWILEVYDVEAAFLNAKPGSKMYIKIPDEMVELGFVTREEQEEFAILLDQNMYGNVDAALRFFEKYSDILTRSLGFTQSKTDPCIFFKHDEDGNLVIAISTHVDDSLIGGRRSKLELFYQSFIEHLKIERLGKLKKHLGVWWEWKEDPSTNEIYLRASMPKMVQEIKEAYADATGKSAKPAKTPAFPGTCLKRATDSEEEIKTTEYRSIVGKLMYYMTKVAPEISNAVRELAGQMIKPNQEHWKVVERAVGYVLSEPHQGLILRKPKDLKPYVYADADYAKNEEDRRSISGRISTLGGMLVGWNSKKQQTVSLSSCESEYISYGEACQEAVFMNQLLGELLGKEVNAVVYGDNQGALFLVKNQQVSQRTKHIDIRNHFVRELQRKKQVMGLYVRSEKNIADGATKNTPEKLFTEHTCILKTGMNLISRREDVGDCGDTITPRENGVT